MVLAAGVTELIRPAIPVNKPTLVMTCEHDSGSTPAMSHAIASEIPGAQTIIVPTLQHLGLIEQPSLFTGPIRSFLDQQLG
jgi:pimeloyl-ACP methyl ester carboxylesterase